MGTHTEIQSIARGEGRQAPRIEDGAAHPALANAARELAATLNWLPGASASDVLAKRCRELAEFVEANIGAGGECVRQEFVVGRFAVAAD